MAEVAGEPVAEEVGEARGEGGTAEAVLANGFIGRGGARGEASAEQWLRWLSARETLREEERALLSLAFGEARYSPSMLEEANRCP